MGGDYTRFTFRPENDYTTVLRQQGRVATDADHNELADILDRRLRAETLDVIGQCTVPRHPADPSDGLPSSFRIHVGATGLAIGRGRAYVDGILAECRGNPASAEAFDAGLGETYHVDPLPWDAQPHFPQHPELTPPVPNRVDLAYLDIWEREVTMIEDPLIREVALGGPDTTTRRQVIWQVRVLEDVDVTSCADAAELQAWRDLVAPSGGRLTTSVDPTFSPDDEPCTIGPVGGYRGLENRLYRVEIQTPGTIAADENAVDSGTARFKWSRDNASLASAVEHIENFPASGADPARTLVRVRVLRRDEVLRFAENDWVEVLDDYTEFRQQSGQMSQITKIDQANRLITLVPQLDLSPDVLNPGVEDPLTGGNKILEERHTRVRRWGRNALQPAIAGPISLEDGIQVEFSLEASGAFHAADYWVFDARTSTGKIGLLDAAHPRGILHHFGRIALINWGSNPAQPEVIDCRTLWPPKGGGCCTVIVNPGESIQQAIDSLPPEGGCVCLKTGLHTVSETIRVDRSNVCIEGESPGTVVRHAGADTVLMIYGGHNNEFLERVCLTRIHFEVVDAEFAPVVEIAGLGHGHVSECRWSAAREGATVNTVGLIVRRSSQLLIERNSFEKVVAGVVISGGGDIEIVDNGFHGPTVADDNGNTVTGGLNGIDIGDNVESACRIERNVIEEYVFPIVIGRSATRSEIIGNTIRRGGALPEPSPPPSGGVLGTRAFGIDCAAAAAVIADNTITLAVRGHGGIRVTAPLVSVLDNQIQSLVREPDGQSPLAGNPLGIYVDDVLGTVVADHCRVCGNILTGVQNAISIGDFKGSDIAGTEVSNNRIVGAVELVRKVGADLTNPELRITLTQPDTIPSFNLIRANYAIRVYGSRDCQVAHNHIHNVLTAIVLPFGDHAHVTNNVIADGVLGVYVDHVWDVTLSDNEMSRLPLGSAFGQVLRGAEVARNHIDGPGWFGVLMLHGSNTCVATNYIRGPRVGIAAIDEARFRADHNTIDESSYVGILASQCTEGIALTHNDVTHCSGAGLPPFLLDSTPSSDTRGATAVGVFDTAGQVTMESCRVIGTGRTPSENLAFAGGVIDVALWLFAGCRVHANEIVTETELPGGRLDDIALWVYAPNNETAHVEIIDNALRCLGYSASWIWEFRHILFANNRVQHTPPSLAPGALGITNFLRANSLSVVANRVASPEGVFPFRIVAPNLSPVANVTRGPWSVTTPSAAIIPGPLTSFNIFGV